MKEVKIAVTDNDIASCWEAMSLLRPMLNKREFVHLIKRQQQEGYVLLHITTNDKIVSVAGFRFMTMLYCGKILYIDDLSTLEGCRGKGYASLLLNHMFEVAKYNQCNSVHLDSGYTRYLAHKLYYKEGMSIGAFHFNKNV